MNEAFDVLVLGSGIAGLFFALKVAEHARVAIVTKKERPESSTNYAQGGIAAALAADDSPALHAADTFVAGAGLCHADSVLALVEEGPARVRELIALGTRFSGSDAAPTLGREGGHSRRRIVHAADLTGREVERALLAAVASSPGIEIFENLMAVDLLVAPGDGGPPACAGAIVQPAEGTSPLEIRAKVVVLATGGAGQVYAHTTNPAIATGDGLAMAYRAGAKIANLEFVQFHPTTLYPADDRAFLISEAMRGEGAVLLRRDGSTFMERYHALESLAPRDVVARAIDTELKQSGEPYVLLDCSAIPHEEIRSHFPNILSETGRRGIDILQEPLPVVPAAHYMCGGILTDTRGRTSIRNLYAIGEVACTGVHGANRLASNSLLEALVFAARAAEAVEPKLRHLSMESGAVRPTPLNSKRESAAPLMEIGEVRRRVRTLMWESVGIVRTDERLETAADALERLAAHLPGGAAEAARSHEALEIRNLVHVAALIVASARSRRESRGLHLNLDRPYRDNEHFLRDTVIARDR